MYKQRYSKYPTFTFTFTVTEHGTKRPSSIIDPLLTVFGLREMVGHFVHGGLNPLVHEKYSSGSSAQLHVHTCTFTQQRMESLLTQTFIDHCYKQKKIRRVNHVSLCESSSLFGLLSRRGLKTELSWHTAQVGRMPAVLLTAYCYAELVVSFIVAAVTIASTHCTFPVDGQAELAWVAWLNTKTVYPRRVTRFCTNSARRRVTYCRHHRRHHAWFLVLVFATFLRIFTCNRGINVIILVTHRY